MNTTLFLIDHKIESNRADIEKLKQHIATTTTENYKSIAKYYNWSHLNNPNLVAAKMIEHHRSLKSKHRFLLRQREPEIKKLNKNIEKHNKSVEESCKVLNILPNDLLRVIAGYILKPKLS